jgi:hypothetical protein
VSGATRDWQAVNDLVHELGEVLERHREVAAHPPRFVDRHLARLRVALLALPHDPGEEALAQAWRAMARARRSLAFARMAVARQEQRLGPAGPTAEDPQRGLLVERVRAASGRRP